MVLLFRKLTVFILTILICTARRKIEIKSINSLKGFGKRTEIKKQNIIKIVANNFEIVILYFFRYIPAYTKNAPVNNLPLAKRR